ncbi:hypothetical protein XA68_12112 [Ophiocordyceps unilateralis]|uniref:Uncharacterized protein n=1 Tax=Ophiocordyceps unilateralis TaxID=268505 RepID=A0A2A9PDK9_OPHUN|nr:hypothetical protein XA68_12112 [Ophiocordyceps unilateralis]
MNRESLDDAMEGRWGRMVDEAVEEGEEEKEEEEEEEEEEESSLGWRFGWLPATTSRKGNKKPKGSTKQVRVRKHMRLPAWQTSHRSFPYPTSISPGSRARPAAGSLRLLAAARPHAATTTTMQAPGHPSISDEPFRRRHPISHPWRPFGCPSHDAMRVNKRRRPPSSCNTKDLFHGPLHGLPLRAERAGGSIGCGKDPLAGMIASILHPFSPRNRRRSLAHAR